MAEAVSQIIQSSHPIELVVEQPFYIPMTGPATRPRRSLKHDDTFIVLDSHGDMGASAGGSDGLFNSDTRYLAKLQLLLDDTQPLLLGSNLRDDNSQLTVDLTNPDVYQQGRLVLAILLFQDLATLPFLVVLGGWKQSGGPDELEALGQSKFAFHSQVGVD